MAKTLARELGGGARRERKSRPTRRLPISEFPLSCTLDGCLAGWRAGASVWASLQTARLVGDWVDGWLGCPILLFVLKKVVIASSFCRIWFSKVAGSCFGRRLAVLLQRPPPLSNCRFRWFVFSSSVFQGVPAGTSRFVPNSAEPTQVELSVFS